MCIVYRFLCMKTLDSSSPSTRLGIIIVILIVAQFEAD